MSASVFHFVCISVINFLKQSKIWFDFDFCLCFNVVYCNVLARVSHIVKSVENIGGLVGGTLQRA